MKTPSIPVYEGKNVTFNNVLSRRLEQVDQESIGKQSKMFEAYVKREGFEPYGPLILRDTTTDQNGTPTVVSEIMVQLKEAPSGVAQPYKFEPKIRLEGAILARFDGDMGDLPMGYSKILLHAYENGIKLGPTTYTVVPTNLPDGEFKADIFRQVV